jgi:hypothetical protein
LRKPPEFSSSDNGAALRQAQLEALTRSGDLERAKELARGANRGGYPETTGPLDRLAWDKLEEQKRAGWQPDRPRRWGEDKVRSAANTGRDPELGNSHVAAYQRMLSRLAGQYLGPTTAATVLHGVVAGDGWRLEDVPAPTGAQASAIYPWFASGVPAGRRAWQRWKRDMYSMDERRLFNVGLDADEIV